jgi:protein O-mannosyl-transferase
MTTGQLELASEERISPAPPPASRRSPRELTLLVTLVLVAATLSLYEPSLRSNFVNYDDPAYVVDNVHVHQGLSRSNLAWAFTTTTLANWHPLTWISYMADARLLGLKPAGYHLDNVLWHVLNVVLLFLLLRAASGYIGRSAVVAALFALCPLNVESVAWIAERKSLLCTAFLFLALLAYGWYAHKPSIGRYLMVALLFAFSLMAKPMAVTLPFALLLLDYWPLKRLGLSGANAFERPASSARSLKLVAEKIPLLLLSLASAFITLYAQRRGGAVASPRFLPVSFRIENAAVSYVAYMWKAVWPSHLAVFYPENPLATWKVAVAAILLLAITAAVWRYREKRYLLTGWLWFLGTLVPMIGIIQVGRQAMADRYAYVPLLGLFVMVVWLAAELIARINLSRTIALAGTLAILSGYAWASHRQIGYWRDSYSLFSHAVEVTTGNGVAEDNLGVALESEMNRPDLALEHYAAAVQAMPDLSSARYDYATSLQRYNRLDEAAREYEIVLASTSNAAEAARAHNNLGLILLSRNQLPAAFAEFNASVQINPNDPFSLADRGNVEYAQHNLDAARADLIRSAQIAPQPMTLFLLGRVLEDRGELISAANAYEATLRLAPGMSDAQTHLDAVRRKLQQ